MEDEEAEWTEEDEQRMWARRRRPEWEPRGRLLQRVASEGGRVSYERWLDLGEECGYARRGLNGFFTGKPPVVRREGDDVQITARGEGAAKFWLSKYAATQEEQR